MFFNTLLSVLEQRALVMGLCCSRHKRSTDNDDFLKIPENAPLKPLQSTCAHFKIHSQLEKNVLLLEHDDFPFLLRAERVLPSYELELWLSGVLTPFPFLKNVHWAWPLASNNHNKEWMIISDYCEALLNETSDEIEFSNISEQVAMKCDSTPKLKMESFTITSQLAEALNHLHSSALIHGNVCPSALQFHRPTASLKLAGFLYLQRVQEGSKCYKLVGDEESFRKPGSEVHGYFEEVDWYSFGMILRWLRVERLAALAEDLIAQRIGSGPAVYSSQIKPRLLE